MGAYDCFSLGHNRYQIDQTNRPPKKTKTKTNARAVAKGGALRLTGLRLAAAAAEGLNPLDRNVGAVQSEAWRLYDRTVRVRCVVCLCLFLRDGMPGQRESERRVRTGERRIDVGCVCACGKECALQSYRTHTPKQHTHTHTPGQER